MIFFRPHLLRSLLHDLDGMLRHEVAIDHNAEGQGSIVVGQVVLQVREDVGGVAGGGGEGAGVGAAEAGDDLG